MDVTVTGYYPPGTLDADEADRTCCELRGTGATIDCTPDHDAVTITVSAVGVREAMWVAAISITTAVRRGLGGSVRREACEPHRIEAARADAVA